MTGTGRIAWIDNLRVLMIIFVVMLHTAVTYSGLGSWYYVENEKVDMISTLVLAFFQTFTQAYFMSLLFMISGYFTQKSLERKSTGLFISGRLSRLGLPLLIYIFLIHPVCIKLAYPEIPISDFYRNGIMKLKFFSWTGPLWFVEALLIFTLIYTFIQGTILKKPLSISFKPNAFNTLILIALITIIAFITRLFFPLGTDVSNLQFGFFPGYIVMFAFGIFAYNHKIFDQFDDRAGKKWLAISLAVGIPSWLLIIFFGGPLRGEMLISGGMNWPAFFYALWESMFCVTFILALVGIFQQKFNKQNSLQRILSDNAFGVFVFHAPVLIAISILFKDLVLYPVVKFIFVSAIAIPATFTFSWLIRRLKIFRTIFS